MTQLDALCLELTGAGLGPYIDNGFYIVSKAQAAKLCHGTLPKPGYERTVCTHDLRYFVMRTPVSCRTDIPDGEYWSICSLATLRAAAPETGIAQSSQP